MSNHQEFKTIGVGDDYSDPYDNVSIDKCKYQLNKLLALCRKYPTPRVNLFKQNDNSISTEVNAMKKFSYRYPTRPIEPVEEISPPYPTMYLIQKPTYNRVVLYDTHIQQEDDVFLKKMQQRKQEKMSKIAPTFRERRINIHSEDEKLVTQTDININEKMSKLPPTLRERRIKIHSEKEKLVTHTDNNINDLRNKFSHHKNNTQSAVKIQPRKQESETLFQNLLDKLSELEKFFHKYIPHSNVGDILATREGFSKIRLSLIDLKLDCFEDLCKQREMVISHINELCYKIDKIIIQMSMSSG